MIHEIAVELRAALVANGCPIPVVDGPEQMTSVVTPRERIVVSRDRGQPEPVIAPKGAGRNPRHAFDRMLRGIGFRVIFKKDLTAEWGGILEQRFAMYRKLRDETIAFGTPSGDEEFYRSYARLVALVQVRTLGGGRFAAEK